MTKVRVGRKQLIKMVVFVLLATVAIFATTAFIVTRGGHAPAVQQGNVTIIGTVMCLPQKDTSGPQTMECAYGIKDEAGQYYGLRDGDPQYRNISTIPMNTNVQITGNLKKESNARYPTIGTIEVTSVSR